MLMRQLDRHFNGTPIFYVAADHAGALAAVRNAFPPGKVITYGGHFCSDSRQMPVLTDRHTDCMQRALVEQRVLGAIGAAMIVTSTFTTFSEVAVRLSGLGPSSVMHGCGRHSPVLQAQGLPPNTTVPDLSAECERSVCVVALSLYGSNPQYVRGALATAGDMRAGRVYRNWRLRVYHPVGDGDAEVPPDALAALREAGAELHPVMKPAREDSVLQLGMAWRFLVAVDPNVDRYVVRDADAPLTLREEAAVAEWAASGAPFHSMRDHPVHTQYALEWGQPLMGGMWGGVRGALGDAFAAALSGSPDVAAAVRADGDYMADQKFLAAHAWPVALQTGVLVHDSHACDDPTTGARRFPTRRVGDEHVGHAVLANGAWRFDDVRPLREAAAEGCEPEEGEEGRDLQAEADRYGVAVHIASPKDGMAVFGPHVPLEYHIHLGAGTSLRSLEDSRVCYAIGTTAEATCVGLGKPEVPELVFSGCDEQTVAVWLEPGAGGVAPPPATAVVRFFDGAWCGA